MEKRKATYEELENSIEDLIRQNEKLREALEKKPKSKLEEEVESLTQEIEVLENRLKRIKSIGVPRGMSR